MKQEIINILIADDSGFMRLMVKQMLQENVHFKVIDSATNGKEAFEKTQSLRPDVVVLDMLMAEYDGLYAVKNIMKYCPTPIILLTSLNVAQSSQVFEALQLGAFDFVSKPLGVFSSKIRTVQDELTEKIYSAKSVDISSIIPQSSILQKKNHSPHTFEQKLPYQIILIGGSTGATAGIEYILHNLPANLPVPVVIGQHMPTHFITSFVQRLQKECPLSIEMVRSSLALKAGCVYLLDAESNWELEKMKNGEVVFQKTEKQFIAYNLPSIDALFISAAAIFEEKTLGIILSGMGRDGTEGMKKIEQLNGMTIAQDKESSVVFGMPRAAQEQGAVKYMLSLREIPMFAVSCLA